MLKKFILGLIICVGVVSAYIPTYASDIQAISVPSPNAEIQRGDVFVYKYTTINGIRCRRLWNATKGEWAEPGWTPCP